MLLCCFGIFYLLVIGTSHGLKLSKIGSSSQLIPSQQLYSTISTSKSDNTTTTTTTTKEEIRALFDRWNDALSTGDPSVISRLYYYDEIDSSNKSDNKAVENQEEKDASVSSSVSSSSSSSSPMTPLLLLPTLSNEPRTNRNSIEKYFEIFMKNKPIGRVINGHIRIGHDGSWAHDSGIYEFSMTNNEDSNSKVVVVQARYSFLYMRNDLGEWKIAHQHSSLMPEQE